MVLSMQRNERVKSALSYLSCSDSQQISNIYRLVVHSLQIKFILTRSCNSFITSFINNFTYLREFVDNIAEGKLA